MTSLGHCSQPRLVQPGNFENKRHTLRQNAVTMQPFRWDPDKNEQLIRERGVSFEQMTVEVENGDLLQIVQLSLDSPESVRSRAMRGFIPK